MTRPSDPTYTLAPAYPAATMMLKLVVGRKPLDARCIVRCIIDIALCADSVGERHDKGNQEDGPSDKLTSMKRAG
jgi:hypothetical protein